MYIHCTYIYVDDRSVLWSVAGHVIPMSERLVEADILELPEFMYPGAGICHTSIGLGLIMVKELTLPMGMTEMR